MAVTFGYEVNYIHYYDRRKNIFNVSVRFLTFQYVVSAPPQNEVIEGMFVPWYKDYDRNMLLQAVGIVGAVIMPHNLYLHSALVKVRNKQRV